jgi:metallo-beta-lactamase family protein
VEPFPIYLDSPMAIAATQIYERHPDLFDRETRELERRSGAIAQYRHLRPTETPAESEALNRARGPCLIMAGAGMCNAGRILHHLRHSLWQSGTMVVIVGFQAVGTLGRRLVDGAESVTIFGEKIAVKAEIHTLNGFSAHAGQSELLGWFQPLADCRPRVFLTHGEAPGREALAAQLAQRHGLRAALPGLGEAIEI